MQRVFAARSPKVARRACFLGAAGMLAIGIPFSLVALAAPGILENAGVAAEGPVLHALFQDVAPPALAVLVLSGIVAASSSSHGSPRSP